MLRSSCLSVCKTIKRHDQTSGLIVLQTGSAHGTNKKLFVDVVSPITGGLLLAIDD